jgi:hypothetical protein
MKTGAPNLKQKTIELPLLLNWAGKKPLCKMLRKKNLQMLVLKTPVGRETSGGL